MCPVAGHRTGVDVLADGQGGGRALGPGVRGLALRPLFSLVSLSFWLAPTTTVRASSGLVLKGGADG